MPRLLHTADIHLGARHEALGAAAAALRERQQGALRAIVDLALTERVDALLIAGDLFDSNTASRTTVERAAAELARLTAGGMHVVVLPGCRDAYSRSSVYRAYDLPALAGGDLLSVLTPDAPWVHLEALDAVVIGPAELSLDSTAGPLPDAAGHQLPGASWRIGMAHAAVGTEPGDIPAGAIRLSGLDYVALGHDHVAAKGKDGGVTWAMAGAPEFLEDAADGSGTVNLVTLGEQGQAKFVRVETRPVGTVSLRQTAVDAGSVGSQAELLDRLRATGDVNQILDVRLVGERPDVLELDLAAVRQELRDAFFQVRVEDESRPPLTTGPLPPPETIAGAFIRTVEGRIRELESAGDAGTADEAAELREVLRLGRRTLSGMEVGR